MKIQNIRGQYKSKKFRVPEPTKLNPAKKPGAKKYANIFSSSLCRPLVSSRFLDTSLTNNLRYYINLMGGISLSIQL